MKLISRFKTSFSLVEVTLAIGVMAFCLIAVFGLIPIGVQSNQTAISQTAAASILSAVISDLRATAGPVDTSSQFGVNFTSGSQTLYFDAEGRIVQSTDSPRYRLSIAFPPNPSRLNAARFATFKLTWPAAADPTTTQPAGTMESFGAFDRHP
jgi:type II secretory pathway pseudopilin PulG